MIRPLHRTGGIILKKLMFFVLTAALVVALAGCGSKESGGTKYKFATDAAYAPMEYMDKDKMTGFDIDFLAEVMKEAGLSYEVANTGWDTMLTSVKQGKEFQAGISSVPLQMSVNKLMITPSLTSSQRT